MWRSTVMVALLASAAIVSAEPLPPHARAEVLAVLSTLGNSGCQFQRNDTWHSPSEAAAHLMRKLEYVEKKASLQTAEQFIEAAAARSSVSGKPYLVRCGNDPIVASNTWLLGQLQAKRAGKAKKS
jgi:Family of unknown function (DUF5329)